MAELIKLKLTRLLPWYEFSSSPRWEYARRSQLVTVSRGKSVLVFPYLTRHYDGHAKEKERDGRGGEEERETQIIINLLTR